MNNKLCITSRFYDTAQRKTLKAHNERNPKMKHKNVIAEKDRLINGMAYNNSSHIFADFNKKLKEQKAIQKEKKSYHKKKSNTYYEQVLVLPQEMFFDDLKNGKGNLIGKSMQDYMLKIKKEFGFEPIDMHLHLDEGHKDKDGKFITNVHAHLGFLNFDFDKGLTVLRKLVKKDFSLMQDMAADAFQANGLNYVRGISKNISKAKHLEKDDFINEKHQELIKELAVMLNTIDDKKNELKGLEKDIVDALTNLKAKRKMISQSDLAIADRKIEYQKISDEQKILKNDRQKIRDEIKELNAEAKKLESVKKQTNNAEKKLEDAEKKLEDVMADIKANEKNSGN